MRRVYQTHAERKTFAAPAKLAYRFVIFGFYQSCVISAAHAKVRYIDQEAVLERLLFRIERPRPRGAFQRARPQRTECRGRGSPEAAKSPFEGSATLTEAQAADLTKGNWYLNVHTAENKGGEIRGQVSPAK
jgi:hypothetical protein